MRAVMRQQGCVGAGAETGLFHLYRPAPLPFLKQFQRVSPCDSFRAMTDVQLAVGVRDVAFHPTPR